MTQILIPILVLRLYAYLKYKNLGLVNFLICNLFIGILFRVTYGVWALRQVFFNSQNILNAFRYSINLSIINYLLLIVLGLNSGADYLFSILALIYEYTYGFSYGFYYGFRERSAERFA